MKKFYLIIIFISGIILSAAAQNWQIYDGSVHPSETGTGTMLDITSVSDDSPGADMIDTVIMDPSIPGNKIFKYFQPNGKRTFRHDMTEGFAGTDFTIVARIKGNSDPAYARVMDLRWDNGNAGTRDELRIYYNGRLKLEKAGVDFYPEIDYNDWHIYRIAVSGSTATVYIDEDPEPVLTGTTTSTSSDKRIRFGDGSDDAIGGFIDWLVLDTLGASAPDVQPLPAELTGLGADETVEWHLYTASVLPDQNDPVFGESNVSGETYMNTIIEDPDMPGNKLLELISSPAASNFMWRHVFPVETDVLTVVARVKAVADTVDRSIEIDLQHGGFRERIYINTNGTFELKEAGLKADLPVGIDMLDWHILRLTKAVDLVNFYLDEDPVPFATVTTATTSTQNYFRFGDGNGSYEIGGHIDWITWTTSGIYGPEEVGLPDVYMKSGDVSLASLETSVGTLVPDFSPEVDQYELLLPAGTTTVNFTAVPGFAAANLAGDGEFTEIPGTATITVTAENGATMDYVVTVSLDVELSTDASLLSLTSDIGSLDPAFDGGIYEYDLVLPAESTAVTLTASPNHENATVEGDGEFTAIPGVAVITVTAEDGTTTLVYNINITLDPTGLNQTFANSVKLYPNPASNRITIQSQAGTEVTLYNALGVLILNETSVAESHTIDLASVLPGMYFVKISKNSESTFRKLIVK